MSFSRASRVCDSRASRGTLQTTLWCTNNGDESFACWILLAEVQEDCNEYLKACKKCKEFGNLNHIPSQNLQGIVSPWPFAKWGMNILDPFSLGQDKKSFWSL